ncbi:MAG: di-trans,poly-cis-decaprenylcistransferase [Clostridiales bacterium]|nr:di-trans,poly-cis-decaprenylcistransferase [Clostridiales bacterium]
MTENLSIPRHVGFIMDGNGRWAKQKNKPRNFGHKKGAENVEKVVSACFKLGVEYISLYAFSTENWARPEQEVNAIMDLLQKFLVKYKKTLLTNEIRLIVSGDRTRLNDALIEKILDVEKETSHFSKVLNIAINYGAKQEILSAVNAILKDGLESVTETQFEDYLYTKDIPPIDLVVRTSGEQRISNFFLWQSAYAEFYFTDVLWPDFNEQEVEKAIKSYSLRNRRFGKL